MTRLSSPVLAFLIVAGVALLVVCQRGGMGW